MVGLIQHVLLFVGLVGAWILLLPILAFLFYSPHDGGPIQLTRLLLKDLFVDLRPGVWLVALAPYLIVRAVAWAIRRARR